MIEYVAKQRILMIVSTFVICFYTSAHVQVEYCSDRAL